MHEGDTSWSQGVLFGIPTTIIVFVFFMALWMICRRWVHKYPGHFDAGPVRVIKWVALTLAIITIVVSAVLFYPWKAEYHQYVVKEGTVENISSRLLGSSDSFQQKFVAEYTDGRKFGCEDTRCSLVRPGDHLVLACKRAWQFAGVDGYDCKFIDSTSNGASEAKESK